MRPLVFSAVVGLPGLSTAAPPPVQPSRPPVSVITTISPQSSAVPSATTPGTRTDTSAVPSVGGVSLPGVAPTAPRPSVKLEDTPHGNSGIDTATAESSTESDRPIIVKPGSTELLRIARGYLNRIVTPFPDPKVLSVNNLEVKTEGTALFLATNAEQPIGVYILPQDPNDSRSISLTLIPSRIPPRTIELKWPANTPTPLSAAAVQRWEEADPYEDKLLDLAERLARGEVPEGYGLTDMTGSVPCALPEVRFEAGQQLTGSHFTAYVARATNQGHSEIQLEGNVGCNPPGLALVAPWPQALLKPNASTEVYVVVVNDQEGSSSRTQLRPSLLSTPHLIPSEESH